MASAYLNLLQRPVSLARNPLFARPRPCYAWRPRQLPSSRLYSQAPVISKTYGRAGIRPGASVGWKGVGVGSVGLGLSLFANMQTIHLDPASGATPSPPPKGAERKPSDLPPLPPPPQSSVNLYELSFGAVAGICAGVFVKKGAKALAFALGGVFVLLQYLGSASLVKVDWGRMSSRFENLFYTTEANGVKRPPTVYSLWRWLVDFLTADFQPRASFVAGFALGLRIG